MPLPRAEVEHIAALARIGLTDEEIETLRDQLGQILDQFQVLRGLDTSGVVPTGHAGSLQTVLRDDETSGCLSREDVLRNAPVTEDEFIRVKPVLEE